MTNADALAGRIDALADALRRAGIDSGRAATILGSAATATMHALMLDAVLEENTEVTHAEPARLERPVEQPLRVAA